MSSTTITVDEIAGALTGDFPGSEIPATPERLKELAQIARSKLVTLAQQRLHTSSRDYVRGIQPTSSGYSATGVPQAVVEVLGAVPFMVEHGAAAFNLRDTLLRPGTRRIRYTKEGFMLLFLPFRHMGPDASGNNAPAVGSEQTREGQPTESRAHRGDLSAEDARKMGRAVWREAKKLAPSQTAPGQKTQWGDRLGEGVGGAQPLRARHATDLYAGMIREAKTYENATQFQYLTFRAISSNPATFRSDEGGVNWTHPGITARHLVPEVRDYVEGLLAAGAV